MKKLRDDSLDENSLEKFNQISLKQGGFMNFSSEEEEKDYE